MLTKNPKARRWHPNIIKWCVYMKAKSPTAYKALHESGALKLPSERTLYNYTSRMVEKPGFTSEAFVEFQTQFHTSVKEEHHKYVVLSVDEMKIREDVVYIKSTGEMSGFVKMTETLDKLRELELKCADDKLDLASHVLQLMVRGVTTSLKFPLAFFPTSALDSDSLSQIIWGAIERLEGIGCRVLAIIGDGAATNRKFFHINATNGSTYFSKNRFARDEDRNIFFIFDAPHLMKTARNCFSKSGLPKYKKKDSDKNVKKEPKKPLPPRRLNNNGQEILWAHIIEVYNRDSKNGIRKLPKLKYEHVFLDSYSRMKVKLATQVLSDSVASGMEEIIGERARETVKFLRIMNKFFDIMNVANVTSGTHKRNPNLEPFRSLDDIRLKWIEEDFLNYFDQWEKYAIEREGNFSNLERKMMQLSPETLEGLRMTSKSVVGVIRFMIGKGSSYVLSNHVLSNHLNQDKLEQHFGKIRSLAGACDNPNSTQYGQNNVKVNVLRQFVRAPTNGNTSV